ncbi:MAG: dTDP-4-dehydrorhamnose reductase [Bacteroidales bacterium]
MKRIGIILFSIKLNSTSKKYDMAVIMVTGSKGQLGNEILGISKKYIGHKFLFSDLDTLDLTKRPEVEKYIRNNKPEWIINCAAYNFVDKAESEEAEAFRINDEAVRNISLTVRDSECRLIHFSSDFVFDGNSEKPYSEYSVARPLSAYGRSKLAGEKSALLHPGTMVIRTSWLYSKFGNNFVKSILGLSEAREMLDVVNDQEGSPTWAADLANAVMTIIFSVNYQHKAFNTGIYHYSNGGSCTRAEFASEIVELSGNNCNIRGVSTAEYGNIAQRPRYSVLNSKKIIDNYGLEIPYWKDSLKKCMKEIKNK